jgi:outer membrane protein assembly factor BamB
MTARGLRSALLLLCCAGVLAGCSTLKGWFSMDSDEDPRQPAELGEIDAQVVLRERWSTRIGKGQGRGLLSLRPALAGDTLYAASADGELRALRAGDGRTLWEIERESGFSGGVGVYEDTLLLGSPDGEVLQFAAGSGELNWSAPVSGEVLSPPQSNGRVVVAQTYDGKLYGLDHRNGRQLWMFESNMPVLTLRGTGTPLFNGNVVYASFSNGRVLAFDAQSGGINWEARVAIAQGRSEIERIVDVDGTMALQGLELYAASYQGRLAAIDVRTGQRLWQVEASAVAGVSLGFGNVYVAEDNGSVTAYFRSGDGARWVQDALAYRGLSRPTPVSSYLAVADFEGYVHLLSQVDGELVGRTRADSKGARADMLADGSDLYVQGDSGKLVAYSVQSRER